MEVRLHITVKRHSKTDDVGLQSLPARPFNKFFFFKTAKLEISEKAYVTSHFKTHGSLEVSNVTYNGEACSMQYLIELPKYMAKYC